MAPMYGKLVVKFDKNASNITKFVDDSSETLKEIKSLIRNISYVGTYECKDTFNIYVQALRGKRINPNVLLSKVSHMGDIVSDPEIFIKIEGELVDELGDFTKRGRKTGTKVIDGRVYNDNSVNNSHNTTNNDNSVNNTYNDNRVVNLHVNALGEGDGSHITAEIVTCCFKPREFMEMDFSQKMSPYQIQNALTSKWKNHLRERREIVREYDRQHSNGEKTLAESYGIPDEKYEVYLKPDKEIYEKDMSKDDPPEYDSDSDSEESIKMKDELLGRLYYESEAFMYKADFFNEFEKHLYNNPHNGNVLASTDKGVFEYFDGKVWIKLPKSDYFVKVIASRLDKMNEIAYNLNKSGELAPYLSGHVSLMLNRLSLWDPIGRNMDVKNLVKTSVLASENNKRRLASVRKTKKIRKISASSLEDKTRYSSWDKLEN